MAMFRYVQVISDMSRCIGAREIRVVKHKKLYNGQRTDHNDTV